MKIRKKGSQSKCSVTRKNGFFIRKKKALNKLPSNRFDNLKSYLTALRIEADLQKAKKEKDADNELEENPLGNLGSNSNEFIGQMLNYTTKAISSFEGFTQIDVDLENRRFKIMRPVKMYGVEVMEMSFDDLIKRFIKNWREWTNGEEVLPPNFFDWIKSVCRYKNIFLEKVINNIPAFRKSIPELYIGEIIFGQQPNRKSRKNLLAKNSYKSLYFIPASDVSFLQIQMTIKDLIEVNYLIEFELIRIKEEQQNNFYKAFKQQIEKNSAFGQSIQINLWSKFWDSPNIRPNCRKIMKMIQKNQEMNLQGPLAEQSALFKLHEFEYMYGRLEQLSLKTRKAAAGIIRYQPPEE